MSLLYWLPMLGSLKNQGLSEATPVNHGATINNSGKLGKCYSFSGSSQYIDTGFKESISTGDFTISAWVKLTSDTTKTYQPIISNKTTAANSVGFAIYFNHNQNKFLWSTADGINATEIWTTDTFANVYNTWTHVVMVRNSSDPKIGYFYINGERQDLASVPPVRNITNATYNMIIGDIATHNNAAYLWTGDICDVRIYDEAIPPKLAKELSKGLVLHYPLNRGGFGGDNYAKNTSIATDAAHSGRVYSLSSTIPSGTTVTISCRVDADNVTLRDNKRIGLSSAMTKTDGSGTYWFETWKSYNNGLSDGSSFHGYISKTQVIPGNMTSISAYIQTLSSGTVTISDIKVEIGDSRTPWIPNSADDLYSAMGLDDGIEYDVSGYGRNGSVNNISYSSDSPRYNMSSVFSGSNPYIKVNSNDWMIQGVSEMTINLWAYADDWTGKTKLFSCTESGGFNTESGASGYIRHPVHYYTNSAQTSTGYHYNNNALKLADLSSGWHMFTFVDTNSKMDVYIDGESYSTYSHTTYGIHYNANARLFLGCEANTANPSSPYFNGKMSDFRIYYTALDDSDILALYNTPTSIANNGTLLTQGEISEV